MSRYQSSCPRCRGKGLVLSIPRTLICLGLAGAWCIVAYFWFESRVEAGFQYTSERRAPVGKYVMIVAPPILLIGLAFSPVLKCACPRCGR